MSPYDCGSKRANLESIFGTNPWLWLLPVRTTNATGFEFDVRGNTDAARAPETEALRANNVNEVDTLGVVSTMRDLEAARTHEDAAGSNKYSI